MWLRKYLSKAALRSCGPMMISKSRCMHQSVVPMSHSKRSMLSCYAIRPSLRNQQPAMMPTILLKRLYHSRVVTECDSSSSAAAISDEETQQSFSGCQRLRVEKVTGEAAEQLSDLMLGFGAQSVMVEEHRPAGAREQPIYSEGGDTDLWDVCDVVAYFALEDNPQAILQQAAEILALEELTTSVSFVPDQEWVDQIKASYVPIVIAPGLAIVPEWSSPLPDHINIILTPGLAFGTGDHPTTSLCLRALSNAKLKDCRVMDYGTGSGVLGIAALKFGALQVVATDTDILAVRASQRNAELSGVQDRMQVVHCGPSSGDADPVASSSGTSSATFDYVVANITRGPLLDLAPRLSTYAKAGGALMLSGILEEQVPDIVDAYGRLGFADFKISSDNGWALVEATKT